MTVSRVDPEAKSTHAAAEGHWALGHGDTVLARQKYTEDGEILERASKRLLPAPDKHLLRFLAASQYYHGGEYGRAAALTAKINRGHLRPGHRPIFDQFRKDVEERVDPAYPARIRTAVINCWLAEEAEKAIKLLQIHPYVFERAALAWLRADLCYQLRRWTPAAVFYTRAISFSDGQPWFVYMRAAGVMRLWATGDTAAAQDYSAQLLKHQPTALDFVAAASVRAQTMTATDSQECGEVLRLVERALVEYAMLSEMARSNRDVRSFQSHGYAAAVIAANRLEDRAAALRWAAQGLAFAPDGPEAEAFRSVLSDPQTWLDFKADPFAVGPRSLLEREKAIRGQKRKEIEKSAVPRSLLEREKVTRGQKGKESKKSTTA